MIYGSLFYVELMYFNIYKKYYTWRQNFMEKYNKFQANCGTNSATKSATKSAQQLR